MSLQAEVGPEQHAEEAEVGPEQHAEAPAPPRAWIALVRRTVRSKSTKDDVVLDIQRPPCPSYLRVSDRLARPSFAFPNAVSTILAVGSSGHLLFDSPTTAKYYVFHAGSHSITRLPDVPSMMRRRLRADQSIGLAAVPGRAGHFILVQLQAGLEDMLCYSSIDEEWSIKPIAPSPETFESWRTSDVLFYQNKFWWVDHTQGVLSCDPFADRPCLDFIRLPGSRIADQLVRSRFVDASRIIRISEGKVRCVEIAGADLLSDDVNRQVFARPTAPSVRIWTFDADLEAADPWRLDFNCALDKVWSWAFDASMIAALLLPGNVPRLAFVNPTACHILYFLHGTSLIELDMKNGTALGMSEWLVTANAVEAREISRLIEAWFLPPEVQFADSSWFLPLEVQFADP